MEKNGLEASLSRVGFAHAKKDLYTILYNTMNTLYFYSKTCGQSLRNSDAGIEGKSRAKASIRRGTRG